MYAYIKGKLAHKEASYVVIDVNGVGYRLNISLQTYAKIKDQEECLLFTHLHVREDDQKLYGFSTQSEKTLFLLLVSVSGIGTNTGIAMLSAMTPDEMKQYILREDAKAIQMIKGIGAKTAQRVIIELKDKVAKTTELDGAKITGIDNNSREEALTALMTLGITKNAADKSLDAIIKKYGNDLSVEELIKFALKSA